MKPTLAIWFVCVCFCNQPTVVTEYQIFMYFLLLFTTFSNFLLLFGSFLFNIFFLKMIWHFLICVGKILFIFFFLVLLFSHFGIKSWQTYIFFSFLAAFDGFGAFFPLALLYLNSFFSNQTNRRHRQKKTFNVTTQGFFI